MKSSAHNKNFAEEFFRVSTKPPPGFESIVAPQTMFVDLYYQGVIKGIAKAKVGPNSVRFIYPEQVVKLLGKDIINSNAVIKALSGNLLPNSKYLCDKVRQHNCNQLFPKIAAILYDPSTFRAMVFINQNYLRLKKSSKFLQPLPDSTAGFSYFNQIYGVSSNSTAEHGYHNYNLTSDNSWGYKNSRLKFSFSLANKLLGQSSSQINAANLAFIHKQQQYTFGMLDTLGDNFFVNQTIVGGKFETILNTLSNATYGVGVPINLVLNFPSQVSVYKSGKLIYTAHYPAGNQRLDTSGFPSGAYPIVIRLTSGSGSTTEIKRFFVKTSQLAPLHMPQYHFSFGYMMADRWRDSGLFAKVLSIPVYQGGYNFRLGENWGSGIGILGTDRNVFAKWNLLYFQRHWSLGPALLFGSKGEIGYASTFTYHRKKFSMFANIEQVRQPNAKIRPINIIGNYAYHYNRLLNLNTLQLNFNASYSFKKSSLSFFATENRSRFHPKTYSLGPSFSTQIWHRSSTMLNLEVSAAKSEHDSSVLAVLRVVFNTPHMNSNVAVGYNTIHHNNSVDQTGSGLHVDGSANWHYTDSTENGHNFGLNVSKNQINRVIGGNYSYQNNRVRLSAFGNYSDSNGYNSATQYGGSFNTHIVYSGSHWTMSGGGLAARSGILAEVKSKNPQSMFDIYSGTRLIKHVKANERAFIKLEPFSTYRISSANRSQSLYHLDKSEQLVTIYPGNVQRLTWYAVRKYVLVGRLLNIHKKPISYAIIHDGIGYNAGDESGYFQLETDSRRSIFGVTNHHNCWFKVPHFSKYRNFYYLGDVICYRKKKNVK